MRWPQTVRDRFVAGGQLRLVVLALVLIGLWFASGSGLTPQERKLMQRVEAAQQQLATWRQQNGTLAAAEDDPAPSGLIGAEWSPVTTTLGDADAKRTATNPRWAVQFVRWFRSQGLVHGDHISISSSGSFPGLLLSALMAAESEGLQVQLLMSLGSSTWGANVPGALWPQLAAELRSKGYLRSRAQFYTLGGGGEMGGSLAPEGVAILRRTVAESGVPLLEKRPLAAMVQSKAAAIVATAPKLFINIGGSHANMGADDAVLHLPAGPVAASWKGRAGDGLLAAMLDADVPVIHMLHLKELAPRCGLPFGRERGGQGRGNGWLAVVGLALFALVLWRHRRWGLEE